VRPIDVALTGSFATMAHQPSKWARKIAEAAVDEHGAMQKRTELAEFLDLLRPRQPRLILEIGSLHGGMSWALRQVAPPSRVIAVDNWVLERRTAPGAMVDVMVTGDSRDPATVLDVTSALDGERADLLFIDGSHVYEDVRSDYEVFAPLVASGGLIALHDIGVPHEHPHLHDVIRFWNEVRVGRPHVTIFHPLNPPWTTELDWGGIGVLEAR
jgi:cephalosporin hydroxylase